MGTDDHFRVARNRPVATDENVSADNTLAIYTFLISMPSLEILEKYTREPSLRRWPWTRTFLSGDGKKAVFSNPTEFRMGAYAWELNVYADKTSRLFSRTGFLCLHPYQPWGHDSHRLFLSSWNEGSFIYELKSGSTHKLQVTGYAISMLGSRRYPRLLVVTDEREYLLAEDGSVTRTLSILRPGYCYPYLNWFDAGGCFFAVENQGAGCASLRFFDADTGAETSGAALNPATVFPYDIEKYTALNRDFFTLALSESVQSVGSLIDQWSSIDFDEETEVLKLMIYRPIGEIFKRQGQFVCQVNENWVEVKLRS